MQELSSGHFGLLTLQKLQMFFGCSGKMTGLVSTTSITVELSLITVSKIYL